MTGKIMMRACVVAVMVLVASVAAEDYEITWHTIDGGGQTSSGGGYSLTGTIGQADTGVASAGDYVLSSGFWPGNFGCIVNLTDLTIFCEQWLGTGADLSADFDGSLDVDMADFGEFASWWFDHCPAGWELK